MTVSDDPCANSMFEALSLSFRDQMSIVLFFFAEIRHIIRSESEDTTTVRRVLLTSLVLKTLLLI